MTTTTARPSARARLLAAADELFYEEGIATVGIDRVIERAGVAKASLYSAFGSKDALVQAYLEERQAQRRERIERAAGSVEGPRQKILAIFDSLAAYVARPGFRGCAFVNAQADYGPETAVGQTCRSSRAWTRDLMIGLCREAGAADPELLGRQLVLLYDGATIGTQMDQDPALGAAARAAAVALLAAAGLDA